MTAWQSSVGDGPAKVTAIELPHRGSVVYLRWREAGNWRWASLGESCRTSGGRLISAVCDRALSAARAKSLERAGGALPVASVVTIGEAAELAFDAERGRWRRSSAHGREIARALAAAAAVWGTATPWASVTRADWRQLWRRRLAVLRARGHRGYRGAELVVQRTATVAEWLVEEGHVLRVVGPERRWRERLAEDFAADAGDEPRPARPRHTLEEMRRILEAAERGDPRFALLLSLGAELRLGQVVRARRSDLDLDNNTFTIRGRAKKRGVVVVMTAGQRAAVARALAGYLAPLEAQCFDYPLFPAGQMPGGRSGAAVAVPTRHGDAPPVGRRWILAQFRASEELAGVPHIAGRAAYGLRRAAVDGAKTLGISREGLMAHGGWTDTQVPDRIYADAEAGYARDEAARVRAQIRGEA